MIKIDAAQALSLLEEVVAEAPEDFVYPMLTQPGTSEPSAACYYQVEGAPSCGVGQALFKAGVTVDQLREMDDLPEDTSIWVLWTEGNLPEGLELTEGARSVFDQFQTSQDKRLGPWSESLDHAKMCYALHATNPQEQ
jgi:hypothetical protein